MQAATQRQMQVAALELDFTSTHNAYGRSDTSELIRDGANTPVTVRRSSTPPRFLCFALGGGVVSFRQFIFFRAPLIGRESHSIRSSNGTSCNSFAWRTGLCHLVVWLAVVGTNSHAVGRISARFGVVNRTEMAQNVWSR